MLTITIDNHEYYIESACPRTMLYNILGLDPFSDITGINFKLYDKELFDRDNLTRVIYKTVDLIYSADIVYDNITYNFRQNPRVLEMLYKKIETGLALEQLD